MIVENDIKIPIFSYEDIRNYADAFLKQYRPTKEIHIPLYRLIFCETPILLLIQVQFAFVLIFLLANQ